MLEWREFLRNITIFGLLVTPVSAKIVNRLDGVPKHYRAQHIDNMEQYRMFYCIYYVEC